MAFNPMASICVLSRPITTPGISHIKDNDQTYPEGKIGDNPEGRFEYVEYDSPIYKPDLSSLGALRSSSDTSSTMKSEISLALSSDMSDGTGSITVAINSFS